ncbi:pilus biosynthesis protein PilX [Geoanaerobacter pelophilus]|uniref:Pilus biosynthesis protein PilX n=1 Tax=Geoanaerobacter pelophilus TaxID=60036 RepID=A0ABQ0MF68_9BACT|nr:pilus assembly PilX N-terminal domain-containing protein [Geoanaerobacter pelophilus]GAW65752.1 pilus biosynthesis protein PilX [Geoanaerobacter pelophilus]
MAILRSEGGAALITALMLTMLTLVIALTLLTIITAETRVSGSQKRYRSSLAAAQGGVELLTAEIVPRLFQSWSLDDLKDDYSSIELQLQATDCLKQKLEEPADRWHKCSTAQASTDPAQAPDVSFRLAGEAPAKGFVVTSKIIDTTPGNSDSSGNDLLDPGGSVTSNDQIVRPRHVPAMYNLSVQGVREEVGSREKARLSVLYAY